MTNLFREMTLNPRWGETRLTHQVDASACRSMLLRKGVGGIKHLEVRDLWGQEIVSRYQIIVSKIPRERNVADALASPSARKDVQSKLESAGVRYQ